MRPNEAGPNKRSRIRRITQIDSDKTRDIKKILKILSDADRKKKGRGGGRNKLNLKDQLLVALEHIREYRTYFYIGKSYDISKSTVYKTVRWIEDTLIKHLPLHYLDVKSLSIITKIQS